MRGKVLKQNPIFRDTNKALISTSFSVGIEEMDNKEYEAGLLTNALTHLGVKYAMTHATVIKLYVYFDKKGREYETPDPLDTDYMNSAGFSLTSYRYFITL